jgi:hypothetical protein
MIEEGRDLPITFEHEGVWYIAKFGRIREPEVLHVRQKDDPNQIVLASAKDILQLEGLLVCALALVRQQK